MFSGLILRRAYYRSTKPIISWQTPASFSRYVSSISHRDEIVSVPVGGKGTVNLTISRPTQSAANNNVLVYLPPGPLFTSSRSSSSLVTPETLKDAFPSTTIVDIQYRISQRDLPSHSHNQRAGSKNYSDVSSTEKSDHRFPTPIHDVFTAWDYITDSLQLHNHDTVNGKKIYYRPRICLVGSHIGGALALSLALTNPNAITAVAVVDGVIDWAGLDEIAGMTTSATIVGTDTEMGMAEGVKDIGTEGQVQQKERRRRKEVEREALRLAARELIRIRRRLFRSHSGYFDAFASPVLFLRAPGRDTPFEPMGDAGVEVDGVVMRYGDGNGEIAIVENGNGSGEGYGPYDDDWHAHASGDAHGTKSRVGVCRSDESPKVTNGIGTLKASMNGDEHDKRGSSSIDANTTASTTDDTSSIASTSTDTGCTHTSPFSTPPPSSTEQVPPPPRRRKVLRRWPPTAHPEDILLPYVNIFTTTSTSLSSTLPSLPLKNHNNTSTSRSNAVDISPVLNSQATELQELLRKACFWGRERSFAEERVGLTRLDGIDRVEKGDEEHDGGGKDVIFEWLKERFAEHQRHADIEEQNV